jgi:hypothetical protein
MNVRITLLRAMSNVAEKLKGEFRRISASEWLCERLRFCTSEGTGTERYRLERGEGQT